MAVASREPSGEKARAGPEIGGVAIDRTWPAGRGLVQPDLPRAAAGGDGQGLAVGREGQAPDDRAGHGNPPRLLARLAVEQDDLGARRIGVDAMSAVDRLVHPPGRRLIIRVVVLHGDGQGPSVGRRPRRSWRRRTPRADGPSRGQRPATPCLAVDHAQPRAAREGDARSEPTGPRTSNLERQGTSPAAGLGACRSCGPPRAGGRRSRRRGRSRPWPSSARPADAPPS